MGKHENKTCGCCGSLFECRVGDISRCQCNAIRLSDAEQDFVAGKFPDCVCKSCLLALQQAYHTGKFSQQLKDRFGKR